MPKIPLQAMVLFFLGLCVGCSSTSPDSSASNGALEMLPRGGDECEGSDCGDRPDDDRCLDWHLGDDGVEDDCYLMCPHPPEGAVAAGFGDECIKDTIHVVSCKDLSNVVLLCEDGREYKFDDLDDQYGTFSLEDCEIVGVWVKAGNNASGDGPGYGEFIELDGEDDSGCGGAGGDGGAGGNGGDDGSGGTGGSGEVIVQ